MKIDINFDIKKKARKQNIHMAKTDSLQFSRYNHRYEIHHTELVAHGRTQRGSGVVKLFFQEKIFNFFQCFL